MVFLLELVKLYLVVLDLFFAVLDLLLSDFDKILYINLLVLLFVGICQLLLIGLFNGFLYDLVQFLDLVPQFLVDVLQLVNLDAKIKRFNQ